MQVLVNMKKSMNQIPADIYGHFSEHLGRCIYGGFWVGKDSEIPNTNGCRNDVVQAFKEIGIPNLRWPGGCFADEYHWKDGIGPNENRKKMINTNWGGVVEDNSFGTHEFMELCDQLGCKPYINGNVGSGTVQEMSEWIEYMTFGGESPMARLRAANGRKEPWDPPMFGVGNENWGCGGNMKPEYYADLYRRFQSFVKQYGEKKVFKIACGPNGDDTNWTEVLMREAERFMDGLSLHYYTVDPDWNTRETAAKFDEKMWYSMLKKSAWIENIIEHHDAIMTKYDPKKRVALVVDEWGTWHKVEDGTNPGFLYQQNTVRDALVAGISLNIFNNHSDRVRVANIAQAVNVLQSPVLTEGAKMIKTPTWSVFKMYLPHHNAQLLESYVSSDMVGYDDVTLSCATVSASRKDNKVTITMTNSDAQKARDVKINLDGVEGKLASVNASAVCGKKLNDMNTFDNPANVVEQSVSAKIEGDTVLFELPAHSVAQIQVTLA